MLYEHIPAVTNTCRFTGIMVLSQRGLREKSVPDKSVLTGADNERFARLTQDSSLQKCARYFPLFLLYQSLLPECPVLSSPELSSMEVIVARVYSAVSCNERNTANPAELCYGNRSLVHETQTMDSVKSFCHRNTYTSFPGYERAYPWTFLIVRVPSVVKQLKSMEIVWHRIFVFPSTGWFSSNKDQNSETVPLNG